VESSTAMTRTRIHSSCGSTASTMRAKIRVGIAIIRSLRRDRPWSVQPPTTAAVKDSITPSENDRMVAARATQIVVCAP